jgi:glycine reductase
MTTPIRVVLYLNQFFAGIGGEEMNDVQVDVKSGPLGPGRALAGILSSSGEVVATIYAGDNRFVEDEEDSVAAVRNALTELRPDLVLAGPAFDAGRYGLACGLVCRTARELGIAAVAGMHPENPGVLVDPRNAFVVPTGDTPTEMVPALEKMAAIGLKLANHEPVQPADVEGYLARGVRRPVEREKPAAERAVDMLAARVLGSPYTSEMMIRQYDSVDAPPPLDDFSNVSVALVTTAGIVPRGNPDGQSHAIPRRWVSYELTGIDSLSVEKWESVHGGFKGLIYNTVNPNYALPLPALRRLEAAGTIGQLHDKFYSVVGAACPVTDARRIGKEIGRDLIESGVGAVILEST